MFCVCVLVAVDPPTLVQLLEELKMVDNWFLFGVYLGVPVDQLRQIKSSHQQGEIELCKVDMLQYWLDNSVSTSWKEVARALEQTKQLVLAASVKQRYLWPTTNSEGKSESCICIFLFISYLRNNNYSGQLSETQLAEKFSTASSTSLLSSSPSPPPPLTTAEEIETEIKADAGVVEELQGLESAFSRTLVKFKVKRFFELHKCDLSEAQLFLDVLTDTTDFSRCDNFDKLI